MIMGECRAFPPTVQGPVLPAPLRGSLGLSLLTPAAHSCGCHLPA